eukprot:PhF_6_TR3413/c1_g1_i2/m.4931
MKRGPNVIIVEGLNEHLKNLPKLKQLMQRWVKVHDVEVKGTEVWYEVETPDRALLEFNKNGMRARLSIPGVAVAGGGGGIGKEKDPQPPPPAPTPTQPMPRPTYPEITNHHHSEHHHHHRKSSRETRRPSKERRNHDDRKRERETSRERRGERKRSRERRDDETRKSRDRTEHESTHHKTSSLPSSSSFVTVFITLPSYGTLEFCQDMLLPGLKTQPIRFHMACTDTNINGVVFYYTTVKDAQQGVDEIRRLPQPKLSAEVLTHPI